MHFVLDELFQINLNREQTMSEDGKTTTDEKPSGGGGGGVC